MIPPGMSMGMMQGGSGQPDPMMILLQLMGQLGQMQSGGMSPGNQFAQQNPQAAQMMAMQNYPQTFGRIGF
jgi:hypothetical protein